jgi:hypothetical protein
MIRGGSSWGRIAPLLACVALALSVAAPATAWAQSAVDEYQLDIPGGGSNPADPSPPPTGASASGEPTGTAGTGGGGGGATAGNGDGARSNDAANLTPGGHTASAGEDVNGIKDFHNGQALDTSSRSAPEVVADTLFDSAMLPIIAVLVLITGAGAWRVLRGRRTLSGQAG